MFDPKKLNLTKIYDTKKKLRMLRGLFVTTDDHPKDELRVLLIDDKADAGWTTLITSLLSDYYEKDRYNIDYVNVSIITMKIAEYKTDNLFTKFKDIYQEGKIDVVISDLRLYPEEELIVDYSKFKRD